MERQKQIEEIGRYMAKVSHSECALKRCEDCKWCGAGDRKANCTDYLIAEHLYNAGYRKQIKGEWVKVYQNKIATVYECSCCKHLTFGTSDYCICGAKMKGGAE
jgi:hypothetical protein